MYFEDIPHLTDDQVNRLATLLKQPDGRNLQSGDFKKPLKDVMFRTLLPSIMENMGPEIGEIMPMLTTLLIHVVGKQLSVRIRDVGVYRVRIGFLPKLLDVRPSSIEEIKAEMLPFIDIEPDIILYVLRGLPGMTSMITDQKVAIYGVDEIAGWFPNSIVITDIAGFVLELLSRDLLNNLQTALQEATEEILSSYGV